MIADFLNMATLPGPIIVTTPEPPEVDHLLNRWWDAFLRAEIAWSELADLVSDWTEETPRAWQIHTYVRSRNGNPLLQSRYRIWESALQDKERLGQALSLQIVVIPVSAADLLAEEQRAAASSEPGCEVDW